MKLVCTVSTYRTPYLFFIIYRRTVNDVKLEKETRNLAWYESATTTKESIEASRKQRFVNQQPFVLIKKGIVWIKPEASNDKP